MCVCQTAIDYLPYTVSIINIRTKSHIISIKSCDFEITLIIYFSCIMGNKVANPYGLSVRTTEFDLFHSLTAVGPKSYGYKIILRV